MRMPNKYGGVGSTRSCRDWYVAATYKNPPCSLLPRKLWLKKECPRLPTTLPMKKKCSLLHQIESYIKNLKSFLEGGKKIHIKLTLLPEAFMSINHTRNNDLLHTGAQVTSCAKVCNLLWSNCCRPEPPKPWYLWLIHLWWYMYSVTITGRKSIL